MAREKLAMTAMAIAGIGAAGLAVWYFFFRVPTGTLLIEFADPTSGMNLSPPTCGGIWQPIGATDPVSLVFTVDGEAYCIGDPIADGSHVFTLVLTNTAYPTSPITVTVPFNIVDGHPALLRATSTGTFVQVY